MDEIQERLEELNERMDYILEIVRAHHARSMKGVKLNEEEMDFVVKLSMEAESIKNYGDQLDKMANALEGETK